METYLGYNDVFLIPNYSTVPSRTVPHVVTELGKLLLHTPVISANMDSVTGSEMAIAMYKAGAIGALHRFGNDDDILRMYQAVKMASCDCIVSIGVKQHQVNLVRPLYALEARYFLIDVAHGHSKLVQDAITTIKGWNSNCFVIAGNVMTPEAVMTLDSCGVDAIKLGLANSPVCTTKYVTGIESPMITTLQKCREATGKFLIADGGIRNYGDICKALAAGADAVMCGSLFADCEEAPLPGTYRGSSSKEVREIIDSGNTTLPEGITISISKRTGRSAQGIVREINAAIRSCMSYMGSYNLEQFRKNVRFGRKTSTF